MLSLTRAIFGGNAAHVAVFKDKHRKVLLTQKNSVPMWVLPGGHLEEDESFEEAAIREYKEETGLVITILGLKSIYRHKKNIEKRVYEGKIIRDRIKINHESRAINWFNVNKLPSPMTVYEQQRIKDALNKKKQIIERSLAIDIDKELVYQLRDPWTFIKLSYFFVKDLLIQLIKPRPTY